MSDEKYMPEWAKRLEDWGKQFDKKEAQKEREVKKRPRWERKGEFIWEIFGNILALFIVNNVQSWFPEFFTDSFTAVLWVMNVSIAIQIIGNALLFLYSPKYFFYVVRTIFNAISIVSMVVFIALFPINVPVGLVPLVQLGLSIIVVIVSIVAIFEFVQIFIPERKEG